MLRKYINIALIVIFLGYFVEKLSNIMFEFFLGKKKANLYLDNYFSLRYDKKISKYDHPLVLKSLITGLLGMMFIIITSNYKNFIVRQSFLISGFFIFNRHFIEALYLVNNNLYNLIFSGIVLLLLLKNQI